MEATAIERILNSLNDQQRTAARHGSSPLLIIAGAGTGKTTTLAHRVACLIASGVDPSRILLLTFTRRAAAEMLRRVDAILRQVDEITTTAAAPDPRARRIVGGTFHAVATRLLRRHGGLIGLEPDFTILDRSDSEDLLNVVRGELRLDQTWHRFPLKGTCLDIYSRCVNTQQPLPELLKTAFPWCIEHEQPLKQLFRNYVDAKQAQSILDYDDLLLFWHALMAEAEAGQVVRERFDCVLVDEYQDTNTLQSEILKHLTGDGEGLTVVGDDAQSIYSFRAATVRNILDFESHYPGATVVTLEQNYRSTQPILNATNSVIGLAAEGFRKELWSQQAEGPPPQLVDCQDEDEQTDYVIARVLEHRESGIELKRQAVLFRASHHSLALEVELSRRNIPFHKYGGLKFIETAHVKDLLSFLRLAENPRDVVAGTRVLMLLPGIGGRRAHHLLEMLLRAGTQFSAWHEFRPPPAAAELWPQFTELMESLASATNERADVTADVARVRSFYAPLLERKYDDAGSRLRDLEQLEIVSGRFADRMEFLSEITLDPPSSTQELPADPVLDEDYLILSTIHSAKGLEWESVYVLHAADGNIPSDMATRTAAEIEEERRLFYVALTRARQWLYVCHPQRYYFHNRFRSDAHSFSQLTRFLPRSTHKHFQRVRAFAADPERRASSGKPHITPNDVRQSLKDMWS